ncbi:MAG: hypothetical protein AB7P03_21205 [Kofleriaceae bacterium]
MRTLEARLTRVRWEDEFCSDAPERPRGPDRPTATEPDWVLEFAPFELERTSVADLEWSSDRDLEPRPYFVIAFLADDEERRAEELLLDAAPLIGEPRVAFRRAG